MSNMLCKYDIEDIDIIFGDGTITTIPKRNVISVSIDKNFSENFFPIFQLKFVTSITTREKITTDNKKVKFKIKINKFNVRNVEQFITEQKFVKNCISDVFDIIMGDVTPYRNANMEMDKTKENAKLDGPEKDNSIVEVFLFKNSHLERYRSNINVILRNCNMTEAILYLCNRFNIDKLLLREPDNIETINELIIPSFSFLGDIKFLQLVYGIYNTDYFIFNDFDVMYMIDRSDKNSVVRTNELPRVFININEVTDDKNNDVGFFEDKFNQRYVINANTTPSVSDQSESVKNELFDDLYILDTTTGELTHKQPKLNGENKGNLRVIDSPYSNKYQMNSIVYNMEVANTVITLGLKDVDIDLLTPNKIFYFNFDLKKEYKKFSGNYKLYSTTITLSREDKSETFASNTVSVFKKA